VLGASRAIEERTPFPVSAEIAKAISVDEVAGRGYGLLRCEGDTANCGFGGHGSAKPVVIKGFGARPKVELGVRSFSYRHCHTPYFLHRARNPKSRAESSG